MSNCKVCGRSAYYNKHYQPPFCQSCAAAAGVPPEYWYCLHMLYSVVKDDKGSSQVLEKNQCSWKCARRVRLPLETFLLQAEDALEHLDTCEVFGHAPDDQPAPLTRCRRCGKPKFRTSHSGGMLETRDTVSFTQGETTRLW